jgi:hypothetical protein
MAVKHSEFALLNKTTEAINGRSASEWQCQWGRTAGTAVGDSTNALGVQTHGFGGCLCATPMLASATPY